MSPKKPRKIHLQQLNDTLFWHCYRAERVFGAFITQNIAPFLKKKRGNVIFALSLVFVTIPSMWFQDLTEGSINDGVELSDQMEEDGSYTVLPQSPPRDPRRLMNSVVTFYCSEPRYTDDTPFITASGVRTRFGIAASNIVGFNTKVQIPEVFGDTFFVVMDRMNPRYNNKPFFDVWVESCEEAKERGVHYTTVGIY